MQMMPIANCHPRFTPARFGNRAFIVMFVSLVLVFRFGEYLW
jgi:hypothetical protein